MTHAVMIGYGMTYISEDWVIKIVKLNRGSMYTKVRDIKITVWK